MAGALDGIRVVEIGGLGPAPFCAMMLADHGAEVLRIERPSKSTSGVQVAATDENVAYDVLSRGRLSAAVDLKHPSGAALVAELAGKADVFLEGFRPGVAERLGIGPDVLCEANSGLVYARMTGWGREGELAHVAGHDINYISVAGVQAHLGREGQPPTPPLSLVGDFGGGGMLMAFGICAALVSRSTTGVGQVVDAAMIDGAALLMAPFFGASSSGFWNDERGTNLLDSGAPFYDCYECSDGRYLSVGAIEPQFYANLLEILALSEGSGSDDLPDQMDTSRWPELRGPIAARIKTRSMAEWETAFAGIDACVAPVLRMAEAPAHPHAKEWGTFTDVGGVAQPAPAPKMSGTPAPKPTPPQPAGANTSEALGAWGITESRIDELVSDGVINDA